MFNLHGTDRLAYWKDFRNKLETSENPFLDVADLWAQAPFVERYLDPDDISFWPDPWKLVLDGKYDDLAISLGMLYTLCLTKRFEKSNFLIRLTTEKNSKSFLVIDNSSILNWEYRSITDLKELNNINSRVVWSKTEKI